MLYRMEEMPKLGQKVSFDEINHPILDEGDVITCVAIMDDPECDNIKYAFFADLHHPERNTLHELNVDYACMKGFIDLSK